jgi:hypothetical protein
MKMYTKIKILEEPQLKHSPILKLLFKIKINSEPKL